MKVDVIIPAHNPGEYLEEALISVFKQSYKNYNIILVDDASKESLQWVKDKYPNITYIRNDENLGPAASRNVGIKAGSSELIAFLDSDDVMTQKRLEITVDIFEKNKDIGMVCGNYKMLLFGKTKQPFYQSKINVDYEALMKVNIVACGSVCVKRSVIDDVGYFNEKYWIAEDYDMWVRISEKHKIHFTENVLYHYRIVPGGRSLTQRSDVQQNHMSNILEIRSESAKRIGKNNSEQDTDEAVKLNEEPKKIKMSRKNASK